MNNRLEQPYNIRRGRALFYVVLLIFLLFSARLFYLQVVRHDYYSARALSAHQRKFSIAAERGAIYAFDRDEPAPLVLNENLPTLFADPRQIDNKPSVAQQIAEVIGGDPADYEEPLEKDTAYVVIKKRLTPELAEKIEEAQIPGVGIQDAYYRAYPESTTAAHVLGFVNSDGIGQYGIEEEFNEKLAGIPGRVEAVTDASGVPLRGEDSNVIDQPVDGRAHLLNIDVNLQKQVEELLKAEAEKSEATNVSALVMDPNNGQIKALANYPTFDPSDFSDVEDFSVFRNNVISYPYEAGSVLKVLSMAAGLNEGVVTPTSTYYDTNSVQVDDRTINNALNTPVGYKDMREVMRSSLNTGVVHILKQLGGGSINSKARTTLYGYYSERFGLGSVLGIELPNEAKGILGGPNEGFGLNVRYANMTFGQGVSTTMLQVASAISSIVNGGTYYQPQIIHSVADENGEYQDKDPVILRNNVVDGDVAEELKDMMQLVVDDGGGRVAKRSGYIIGGKTGTAQRIDEDGNYTDDTTVGSFVGFIEGGDGVEYVIMTRVDEPKGYRFAGSGAAAPMFADIANWLIDYERIPPANS